mmetsp:Transcript_28881/g.61305  ORF Transcript_28881/g.61305 Transcript_28881/m.61305 type:complete len:412 (+) Transcript_28881:271-1506(+)|eukprot:CAMPEP_0171332420 /NCGR_PEP_ID=MMETSP0878-20121228/3343_1 /TAXON_ID=67004 /ORGANISM="Thalassiosira weissflogii, Strain CCMP1336" /LENGTH=411 /DNA_ID=CAMNT_0011833145 /DNA_START=294 /DNA_END=1529 /DNA_ORIENTATION=+
MKKSINSSPIFFLSAITLLAADDNALAFTSATRIRKVDSTTASKSSNSDNYFNRVKQPSRIPSSRLEVATIDGSFVFGEDDVGAFAGSGNNFKHANGVAATSHNSNFMRIKSMIFGGRASTPSTPRISNNTSTNNGVNMLMALGAMLSLLATFKTETLGSTAKLLRSLSTWYLTRLEMAPLVTKSLSGGLIAFLGDYGAQWFEYKQSSSDKSSSRSERSNNDNVIPNPSDRASRFVSTSPRAGGSTLQQPSKRKHNPFSIRGTYNLRRSLARSLECILISSPLMHYGYDLFESLLPVSSSFAALAHVVADSVFLDGIFVGTGIIATGIMEGHSLKREVLPNLRNVYVPTLKASVATSSALMPLQFLSFRFLPVQLRVLSVNAVDLVWTGVVSFVSHGGGRGHHHRELGVSE